MPENDDDANNDLVLRPTKPEEAREQAAEFLGFLAGIPFDLGKGETWVLPNPSLLDPEQSRRYNEYLFDEDNVDREPPLRDEHGNVIARGRVRVPAQRDGELLEPSDIRFAKALMGDDEIYENFIKAGGFPSQLSVHWAEMGRRSAKRLRDDSKS